MALIIPKCNADSETLDYTLKVYYDADDWVTNAELIDKLSSLLIDNGIESVKKEPQSYTKKTQVLSYYGFLEWEDESNTQSRRKISPTGKKFYELRQQNNKLEILRLLVDVLNTHTFGRNVLGCDSDSDMEAPNIFLKSTMILGKLTNKEFAYIIGRMELNNADYADTLFEVLIKRRQGVNIVPIQGAEKWADPKPILALADWGLFDTYKEGNQKYYQVESLAVNNLGEEICKLRTRNTDPIKCTNSGECHSFEYENSGDIKPNYLEAFKTKPFLLLAGISGTGKSRIVRELAFKSCPSYLQDKDGTTPGNYCMIEVKPNWHDSSELLGYYSNISKKYIFTKFVKFLVRAMMHPTVPFFVCLDEMNLAPVEQYFAEFLSVLETRKLIKDEEGKYHVVSGNLVKPESFVITEITKDGDKKVEHKKFLTDKQWFYEFFGETELTDKEKEIVDTHTDFTFKEKGLSLPENVFVVGTVNMDDTTHQFSRKVIDRAMTIEMNGGDLEDMFGGSKNLEYVADDDILTMDNLGAKYVSADDVIANCEGIKDNEEYRLFITGKDTDGKIVTEGEDTLPRKLYAINDILKNTPFQVSYRVFNELVIYLAVLLDKKENADKAIEDLANMALDQIMLMKILPRIEGDYEMFNPNGEDNKLEKLQEIFHKDTTKSGDKLDEMIKRLDTTEFTRFWP